MRTDSTRISPVAQNQVAEFITERFWFYIQNMVAKVKNSSGAQDAHEAIRPSNVFQTPESIAKYLDKDRPLILLSESFCGESNDSCCI